MPEVATSATRVDLIISRRSVDLTTVLALSWSSPAQGTVVSLDQGSFGLGRISRTHDISASGRRRIDMKSPENQALESCINDSFRELSFRTTYVRRYTKTPNALSELAK